MNAAKHVFAEAGYHGASIHAIIERAQIARGTFYLYFESKAAVFDSILDQAMADLRARIHRIEVDDTSAPPPQVQLREQVDGDARLHRARPRRSRRCCSRRGIRPTPRPPSASISSSPRSATCCAARWSRAWRSACLRKVDPELAASAMLGMIRGVIEQLIREPDAAGRRRRRRARC